MLCLVEITDHVIFRRHNRNREEISSKWRESPIWTRCTLNSCSSDNSKIWTIRNKILIVVLTPQHAHQNWKRKKKRFKLRTCIIHLTFGRFTPLHAKTIFGDTALRFLTDNWAVMQRSTKKKNYSIFSPQIEVSFGGIWSPMLFFCAIYKQNKTFIYFSSNIS